MSPNNKAKDLVNYIKQERQYVIQALALAGKKLSAPQPHDEKHAPLYGRLNGLFILLENEIQMTPYLKDSTQIDKGLYLMFARPEYRFPAEYSARAKALYDRWEADRWGASEEDAVVEVESTDEEQTKRANAHRSSRRDSATSASSVLLPPGVTKLPPPNHPIWGVDGIMYGVAKRRGGVCLDPRYKHLVKNPKVFGLNGIENGTWYPRQLVARFHGAHGHQQAGIFGDAENGAYSIVVGGSKYEDLDRDNG